MSNRLCLILGDQLNGSHSWFRSVDPNTLFVLMEVRQETDYVLHHVQKVLAFFASMRAFADELRARGHRVRYLKLDDPDNRQSLTENLLYLIQAENITTFEYQLPDEYRLDQQLRRFCRNLSIPAQAVDTEHFLSARDAVEIHFQSKKQYLLESFYRMMRKRHDILLDAGQPVGGRWNYDVENRQKYDGAVPIPEPLVFHNEVRELRSMINRMGVKTFGQIDDDRLPWPIRREQAEQALAYFIETALPHFGSYQDAMTRKSWSLFHSRLSFALNTKMLHPMEVILAAVAAWHSDPWRYRLPQVEGFVRQILGWREYLRGVYWAQMPGYRQLNYFDNEQPLPHYYWDGDTRMHCLHHAIGQSLRYAYAHHIQRLMVTGNFALLAGVHPDAVDAWYLGVYIDAIEWVEITNTRGMSQYADGGLVATKPYVSTANYIQKMSDYCTGCHYDAKKKISTRACPFNSLYWAFYDRNRDRLAKNPRIGMMYRIWDQFSPDERYNILAQAEKYLTAIEDL